MVRVPSSNPRLHPCLSPTFAAASPEPVWTRLRYTKGSSLWKTTGIFSPVPLCSAYSELARPVADSPGRPAYGSHRRALKAAKAERHAFPLIELETKSARSP